MKVKKTNSQKRFHLTKLEIQDKMAKLDAKIKGLEGPEHKNKRKNLYSQLAKLKKALDDPSTPDFTREEIRNKANSDKLRRISKKIMKKKEIVEAKKREKNAQRRLNCLYCKKYGHTVRDCAEREKAGVAVRICYKCGEDNHNLDDCPQYDQIEGFPHVTCFICKETGHLSKDCKDAKNGIFYKGGGCYFCGSNQHKKMDCPKLNKEKTRDYEYTFDEGEY